MGRKMETEPRHSGAGHEAKRSTSPGTLVNVRSPWSQVSGLPCSQASRDLPPSRPHLQCLIVKIKLVRPSIELSLVPLTRDHHPSSWDVVTW